MYLLSLLMLLPFMQVVAHTDGEGEPLIYVNRQYRLLGDVA